MLATLAVLVILACGAAASVALLPPGETSLALRIASVFGLGYAFVALLASLLVLAHVLTVWVTAVVLIAAVGGMIAVAVRRDGTAGTMSLLAAEVREAGAAGLLGFAAVAAVGLARLGVPRDPLAGGWRYWSDGLEIADAGHIPSQSLQWGALHPPAISKLAANAYNATLAFPLVHHPYDAMAASLWLSAAGLAAGLWALGWEMGLRWAAPMLALAGLVGQGWPGGFRLDSIITYKLQFFEDEDIGRMCAVVAAALAIAAVRGDAGRRRALLAGAVLAAAALSHLVPTLVLVGLIVAYAVAHALLEGEFAVAGRALAITLGVAAVITFGTLGAAGGDIGLGGASGGGYKLYEGRDDPTAALLGKFIPTRPKSSHRFYVSPREVLSAFFTRATFLGATVGSVAVVVAIAVALALAAIRLGGPPGRVATLTAALLALELVGAALVFSFRYAYYIQGTFGTRRLFDYASLPLLLVGAAALDAVLLRIGRADNRLTMGSAGAVLAAALLYTGVHGLRSGFGSANVSDDLIAAAVKHTPCNTRLLTPFTTRGSFQALTGRASVREGLMVFLRPDILTQALAVQRASARFYAHPAANAGLLRSLAIDDVLAYRSSQAALDRVQQLRRVGAIGDVLVYRVVGIPDASAPRPHDAPGYHCVVSPL
ncbi:MAG: hypothetical protein ACTHNU_04295 [Gaiellales bacterium]